MQKSLKQADRKPYGLAVLQLEAPRCGVEKVPDAILPLGLKLDGEESLRAEQFIGMHETSGMEGNAEWLVLNRYAVAGFAIAAGKRKQKIRERVLVHADPARAVVIDDRQQRTADGF